MNTAQFTVFFEEPFWVGVYERSNGRKLQAARIVFGAEPKDCDVYEFLQKSWGRLRFSPPVGDREKQRRPINPKRMQRAIHRRLAASGTGTKAQQAIKLLQEQGKTERKTRSRAQREADKEYRSRIHCQKRKEKHKGH